MLARLKLAREMEEDTIESLLDVGEEKHDEDVDSEAPSRSHSISFLTA